MNAQNLESPERKLIMWYKIKEKKANGFKKLQISRELGIDVKTVRRYLKMSYAEFKSSETYKRKYIKRLDCYEDIIRKWLDMHPDLSSSQVYDWLREHYKNFPQVSIKTVYNYVKFIRTKYAIEKPILSISREYTHLEETAYGEFAQVDFGEMWMRYEDGRKIKVYFFVMILCRSRKKYVWFSRTPFTAELAIYAHEKAFSYFGGIPKKIIYDQDAIFIHRENLGDYILTKAFNAFVNQIHFQCIFCRKADPESKGKVENAVKYVKYNFLRCRTFKSIEQLNEDVEHWLIRTANGLQHHTTKLIPDEVFKEEQSYLTPYIGTPSMPAKGMKEYKIRKDNIIRYKGNDYGLPLGSYKNEKSFAWVNICDNIMEVYDGETGKQIAKHILSKERGKYYPIQSPRKQWQSISKQENLIIEYCNYDLLSIQWLKNLKEKKPRYYSSNIRVFSTEMKHYEPNTLHLAFEISLDRGLYNAKDFMRLCERIGEKHPIREPDETWNSRLPLIANETPEKTNIQNYNKYIL